MGFSAHTVFAENKSTKVMGLFVPKKMLKGWAAFK